MHLQPLPNPTRQHLRDTVANSGVMVEVWMVITPRLPPRPPRTHQPQRTGQNQVLTFISEDSIKQTNMHDMIYKKNDRQKLHRLGTFSKRNTGKFQHVERYQPHS